MPTTNSNVNGGPDRDRTGDLLVANEALSQLSYRPIAQGAVGRLAKVVIYMDGTYCLALLAFWVVPSGFYIVSFTELNVKYFIYFLERPKKSCLPQKGSQ